MSSGVARLASFSRLYRPRARRRHRSSLDGLRWGWACCLLEHRTVAARATLWSSSTPTSSSSPTSSTSSTTTSTTSTSGDDASQPSSSSASETQKLREAFRVSEAKWAAGVDLDSLSPAEKLVHLAHEEAVKNGRFTYKDPATGLTVLTRLRHFLKGKCCGNACRHCVYKHENAPVELRKKRRFNTSFYVDTQDPTFEEKVDYDEIFRSIEPRPKGMT